MTTDESNATTVTHHLAPTEVWEAHAESEAYVPEGFAEEGFIHCTDGEANVIATANRYYQADPRPFVVLAIDLSRVVAPVTRDDPGGIYPHIHGPLDRAAVVSVHAVRRGDDGTFLDVTARAAR